MARRVAPAGERGPRSPGGGRLVGRRKGAMPEPRIWYDPPPFNWGRVLRIGGLWLAIVLALLLPLSRPLDEEKPPATPPAPQAVAGLQAPAAVPASAPAAVGAAAAPASAAVSASREVEACGGVKLKLDTAWSQIDTRDALRRSLAAMRSAGSELAQASALALETVTADDARKAPRPPALDALIRMAADTRDGRVYGLAYRIC